jgi:hypothetical protein
VTFKTAIWIPVYATINHPKLIINYKIKEQSPSQSQPVTAIPISATLAAGIQTENTIITEEFSVLHHGRLDFVYWLPVVASPKSG